MSLRYKGGLISPSVNPLAANITTSPNVAQYNGVFTLQQQGQAITSGQWATDPYYKNTTLLLHADGKANGSQNNTFLDSSTNNFTITRNGNTTQGSFTPYGPDWSNYFNGSSYLSFANSADFQFGTGDFTIECWTNLAAIGSAQSFLSAISGASTGFDFGVNGSGYLYLDTWVGATNQIITATNNTLTANNWIHIAVTNTSGTFRLFVNGVSCTFSSSISQAVGCGANAVQVGHMALSGYPHWLTGYVSNLRVVKGTSVYTSNFTPSTVPLTAITNTTLLTCTSNSFADINTQTTAKTATVSGTPSVQRFSPFPPQYQYTPAVIGGSGYFDGSGDYLSIAANSAFTFGTGAFSIESWVYGNTGDVFGNLTFTASNDSVRLRCGSGTPLLETWNATIVTSTINLTANAWNHLVATFDGTRYRLFVNGVLAGSGTTTYNLSATSTNYIGYSGNGSFTSYYTGYMQGLRVVKGGMPSAYSTSATTNGTAVFTPPTAPLTGSESLTAGSLSLLCNMTNAGIYDNAMMNNLETVGNAQVSTSVVKYGSGSLAFDGSGDYLKVSTSDLGAFGTGDFTIEMWVYFNNVSGTQNLIDFRAATADVAPTIALTGSALILYVTGSTRITTSTLSATTWYHVACVRSSGVTKMYVNGTQSGSNYTDTNSYVGKANRPWIGELADGTTPAQPLNGYIDDLRVTKGLARYTANFQPPKVAFANQ